MGDYSMRKDWRKEYKKCKEDPAYFYEHYFKVDGKKPSEYSIKNLNRLIEENRVKRRAILNRSRGGNYFQFIIEYPITPEEAFPLSTFLDK